MLLFYTKYCIVKKIFLSYIPLLIILTFLPYNTPKPPSLLGEVFREFGGRGNYDATTARRSEQ